ncbi:MAG: hypothetical protein MdMp024_1023 [Bacteroidales bacterium]
MKKIFLFTLTLALIGALIPYPLYAADPPISAGKLTADWTVNDAQTLNTAVSTDGHSISVGYSGTLTLGLSGTLTVAQNGKVKAAAVTTGDGIGMYGITISGAGTLTNNGTIDAAGIIEAPSANYTLGETVTKAAILEPNGIGKTAVIKGTYRWSGTLQDYLTAGTLKQIKLLTSNDKLSLQTVGLYVPQTHRLDFKGTSATVHGSIIVGTGGVDSLIQKAFQFHAAPPMLPVDGAEPSDVEAEGIITYDWDGNFVDDAGETLYGFFAKTSNTEEFTEITVLGEATWEGVAAETFAEGGITLVVEDKATLNFTAY